MFLCTERITLRSSSNISNAVIFGAGISKTCSKIVFFWINSSALSLNTRFKFVYKRRQYGYANLIKIL